MEEKRCKNKKCMKLLPDDYKYKYCEACRNERASKVKKVCTGMVTLAGAAIVAVPRFFFKKK